MYIKILREKLKKKGIYHSDTKVFDFNTIIGYEKKFKLNWFATQLNTFIVITDFKDKTISIELIEKYLYHTFKIAENNYTGWPRGLQSGMGIISILISSNITSEAIDYCKTLKSSRKWSAFIIPVVLDTKIKQWYWFERYPLWGWFYYPHFHKLIRQVQ